jgi:hypothetical protein
MPAWVQNAELLLPTAAVGVGVVLEEPPQALSQRARVITTNARAAGKTR